MAFKNAVILFSRRSFASSSGPKNIIVNGAVVDGRKARLSVWDQTVQRGDGMFEVVRVLPNRKPLATDLHMDRLFDGAKVLDYAIPASRTEIASWIEQVSQDGGEGMVRVLLTRGSTNGSGAHIPDFCVSTDAPPSVVVMWQPLPKWPAATRLLPLSAWWHPAGVWQTVKWLSYGPNMHMSRTAAKAGFDDAVLTSVRGDVLDGPTFAIGWFKDRTLYTPDKTALGLLPSCTLALALSCAQDIGLRVVEGVFPLKTMLSADEVFVTSSTKDVLPVCAVGDTTYPAGPCTAALAARFREKYFS